MSEQTKQYYTANEAQAKLGISKSLFHRKVRLGLIPKIVFPGMKQGVYPKRDVDALALSVAMDTEKVVFSKSTPADQVEEMNLGVACFGRELITPLPDRIAFQQKSDFTFHSLKIDEHVVGYVSMFHLRETLLEDLLVGRKIEREIKLDHVLPFLRLEHFPVYFDVIAVDPRLSAHLQKLYAGIIITHIIDLIINMLTNDYYITDLYTVTTSKQGKLLVEKMGFQQMEGKSLALHRIAYRYILDASGIQYLQNLRDVFHKRSQPSTLTSSHK